jgi:glutathione synthase/RimK-type ligase-like ATP-grasp enzyme
MKKCAILTMDSLDGFEAYDYLLDDPLSQLGWQTELVSWRQANVNWDNYAVVIIRTPWDYQDDAPAFLAQLKRIENSTAILENSLEIVNWNIHKRYLQQLAAKGVDIVPTLWREQFDADELTEYFDLLATEQIVIKPCISANADNTFWIKKGQEAELIDALYSAFSARDFMIQPFIQSVIEEGEFSCFFFDGNYSHSILKTPKKGDFRVQEEHGGQLTLIEPESKLKKQALDAVNKIGQMPLYARVDFVRNGDSFALMEAELIEPSLYFNMDPESPMRFAKAFNNRMKRLNNL